MSTHNDLLNKEWFAIRVTYNREMMVKQDLDNKGVENFVPMQYIYSIKDGKRIKKLVPTIHNLIFIHVHRKWLKEYKAQTTLPIRYIMDREKNEPLTIPERQMTNFIAVAGTFDEQLIYVPIAPGDFQKGEKVRITGGIFAGAEGIFIRFKGDRRVVVTIPGVVAVATTFIHPSLIEKIES